MGGGGSIGMMNSTIKNNRNLLRKRDRLKNTLSSFKNEKPEYNFPDATKHSLRRIKSRLQDEHRQRTNTRIMIMIVISVSLISGFIYFMS